MNPGFASKTVLGRSCQGPALDGSRYEDPRSTEPQTSFLFVVYLWFGIHMNPYESPKLEWLRWT
jgi:hypothetical protein